MRQVVSPPVGNSCGAGTEEGDRLLVGGKGRGQRPEALHREIEPRSFFFSTYSSLSLFLLPCPVHIQSIPLHPYSGPVLFSFFPSLFCWQQPPPPTPSRFYTGESIQSSVSRKNEAGSSSWIVDFAPLA